MSGIILRLSGRFHLPLLLLLSVAGLGACSLFQAGKGLKSCRYSYKGFGFSKVDGERSYWSVDVGVANPNARPVTLEKMRFALLHGKDTLVSGWNPGKLELAAGDSAVLHSTLEIPHTFMQRLPPGLLRNTAAEFTLSGDAYLQTWLGEVQVPNAFRKTIHVNMPQQIARVRDHFMKRLFLPPGRLSPSPNPPSAPPPGGPSGPALADEPL
jgi:hypothetical protein